jgi:hypothetical protein
MTKRAAVIVTLWLSLARESHAATVTVLRPDGRPLAEAAVMCRGHENDPALTGDDGRATVPDDCSSVTCMAGEYVLGRTEMISGSAFCRLVDGVQVTLRLDDSKCGEYCAGALDPVAPDGDRASREFGDDAGSPQSEARLGVLKLGAYTAEVLDDVPFWSCRESVELRRTGEQIIQATWRSPHDLPGVVLGENGTPVADVQVRVRHTGASGGSNGLAVAWRCERSDEAPDIFTAEDGSFVVPIDPADGGLVEAGSSWDPDGFASLEVTLPIPPSITLRLQRTR